VVQPNFDHLSCAFARIVSIGALTRFEVRGARREFDDRWRWLETSVVPRFRRFDADMRLVDASLRRILEQARHYASMPCVLPP
jgi:hypothetical protein